MPGCVCGCACASACVCAYVYVCEIKVCACLCTSVCFVCERPLSVCVYVCDRLIDIRSKFSRCGTHSRSIANPMYDTAVVATDDFGGAGSSRCVLCMPCPCSDARAPNATRTVQPWAACSRLHHVYVPRCVVGVVVPAVPKDHATGSASACHACCTCVRGVRDLCGVWLNHTHTHTRARAPNRCPGYPSRCVDTWTSLLSPAAVRRWRTRGRTRGRTSES